MVLAASSPVMLSESVPSTCGPLKPPREAGRLSEMKKTKMANFDDFGVG